MGEEQHDDWFLRNRTRDVAACHRWSGRKPCSPQSVRSHCCVSLTLNLSSSNSNTIYKIANFPRHELANRANPIAFLSVDFSFFSSVNGGNTAVCDVLQAEGTPRNGAQDLGERGRLERPRRFRRATLLVLRRGITSVEECLGQSSC